jgi:L-iditol 2-dehydrogenase
VDQYKKGDRVFVSHHVPCNTCRYCLNGYHTVCDTLHSTNFDPGGYAEYLRVPPINVDRGVFLLPEEISYEDGSFIEPLACVIRGQRFARFQPGSSVLVMGSGISGILHIALANAMGAGRVIATDINEFRLESALRFGADVAFNAKNDISKNLLQANENRPVDLVIICTGALSAFTQALQLVDRGGAVLFFAPTEPGVDIPLSVNDFWRKGITLMPSYGASPLDIYEAINLIRARKVPVQEMITHRYSLAETGSAFQLVANAADSIKVIIEPQR